MKNKYIVYPSLFVVVIVFILFILIILLGGERSIVAICLFLCLNKIDNFSFFFFDEIDAALDTVHRDNLSILYNKQMLTHYISL